MAATGVPLLVQLDAVPNESRRDGTVVLSALKFDSLLDLLPGEVRGAADAVGSGDDRVCMSHIQLKTFISAGLGLREWGIGANDRVGCLVPTGPESATTFLSCISFVTYAPLNPASQEEEIRTELKNVNAKALIVQAGEDNSAAMLVADEMDILVIEITISESIAGMFTYALARGTPGPASSDPPHGPQDHSLVLHTSGTTGKKKVVPYRLGFLVCGASVMAASYEFGPTDINLNMMPLFHVGGLARNVLAPALTGGCTFCLPAFNATQFWEMVTPLGCTWYYGSPTMHQLILEASKSLASIPKHNIRLIANAAGPLPHIVALKMREVFGGANVLPSYGMTECMPITAPPLDYNLEKPGTSGYAAGPQVAAMNGKNEILPPGETGEIVVKGPPCFEGYDNNPDATAESFYEGWFKTGDKGHVDEEGWLFITGRSKEVINRGGEIISPTEIENEVLKHDRVRNCIAFVAPHDLLQEVVGLVVVPEPGQPVVGLTEIQRFVSKQLFPAKWPQCIVYMNDLPKGATGKPLRVKLGSRLSFPEMNDAWPKSARHFDADTPPQGTKVQEPIAMERRTHDLGDLRNMIMEVDEVEWAHVVPVMQLGGFEDAGEQVVAWFTPSSVKPAAVMKGLMGKVAGSVKEDYLPDIFVPLADPALDADGNVDIDALMTGASTRKHRNSWRLSAGFSEYMAPRSELEQRVQNQFNKVLGRGKASGMLKIDEVDEEGGESKTASLVSVDADFFAIGGDSIKAGQLAGLIRKTFNVPVSGTAMFRYRTVAEVTNYLENHSQFDNAKVRHKSIIFKSNDAELEDARDEAGGKKKGKRPKRPDLSTYDQVNTVSMSSNRPIVWAVQSIPFLTFHPIKRVGTWALFIFLWIQIQAHVLVGNRFLSLIMALVATRIVSAMVVPTLGIVAKWVVIGRYKEGTYPTWGSYYLRWWFVHQVLRFTGLGAWGWSAGLKRTYYRLLGAKVGEGAKISDDAVITEADLVTIGVEAMIDAKAFVCPFTLDKGSVFTLNPVRVGHKSVVCTRSLVCPGTEVADTKQLGPLSCTYEMLEDDDTDYAKYCRVGFSSGPPIYKWLIGYPCIIVIYLVAYLPVVLMIYFLVSNMQQDYREDTNTWWGIVDWFLTPHRLVLYLCVRAIRKCVTPFIRLFLTVLTKKLIIGKFEEGPIVGGWNQFRRWFMHSLLPDGEFCGVKELIGSHYEGISVLHRLFGAKIGKRVYWPGSGVPVVEYDLFECGDDAVWGSRNLVMCGDRDEAKKIVLEPGANVSDRSVLLPGVRVGSAAVLGSSTIGSEDHTFPPGTKWLGSMGGKPVLLEAAPDIPKTDFTTPFSRAVYFRKARGFYAFRWWQHFFMNTLTFASIAVYRSLRIVIAWVATYEFLGGKKGARAGGFGQYIACMFGVYALVSLAFYLNSIIADVLAKWMIIGRRGPGLYPWDQSSYCQRWKLYLLFQHVRNTFPCLHFLEGTQYMCWYWRAMGCCIGKDVCLYPTGGDPMMTEPEMVTIGDRVGINDAILVAHLNTSGVFGLDWVTVEQDACLRRFSRLMAGGTCEPAARMLEHTLVLPGNAVDEGTTWQGWPSQLVDETDDKYVKSIADLSYSSTLRKRRPSKKPSLNYLSRNKPRNQSVSTQGEQMSP